MTITSTAFQPNEPIPAKHSYDGGNVSPPLTFSETPTDAKALVLIVEDPDAPSGTFTHWILYNISPATLQIPEGELPIVPAKPPTTSAKSAIAAPNRLPAPIDMYSSFLPWMPRWISSPSPSAQTSTQQWKATP